LLLTADADMAFSPEYIRCVLRENFEGAKALFVGLLLAADRARLSEGLAGLEPAAGELTCRSAAL
jgi:hypothetical protein